MPQIHVAKTFNYNPPAIHLPATQDTPEQFRHRGNDKLTFYAGQSYDVPDEIAGNWYVKCHLVGYAGPVEAPRAPFTAAQQEAWARQQARAATPIAQLGQPPAPQPPDTKDAPAVVASRSGMVSEDAVYFAGGPQVDKPLPSGGPSWMGSPSDTRIGITQSGGTAPVPPLSAPSPTDIPPFGFKPPPESTPSEEASR